MRTYKDICCFVVLCVQRTQVQLTAAQDQAEEAGIENDALRLSVCTHTHTHTHTHTPPLSLFPSFFSLFSLSPLFFSFPLTSSLPVFLSPFLTSSLLSLSLSLSLSRSLARSLSLYTLSPKRAEQLRKQDRETSEKHQPNR